MTTLPEIKIFTLSRITARIADIVKPVSGKTFWVQAEIGEVSEKSGNTYGSLVEMQNGRQIAKLSFRMWKRDKTNIAALFAREGLALELKNGMKVILECRLEYHALYGLYLVVINADPRFFLGEMELRKREIIERLRKRGDDSKNKQRVVPRLPMRIGIITSRDSAAYADVYKTLERGSFAYRLSFTDAIMQGENAEASILRALQILDRLGVDLVILVRGGGSKTDLATLDNEHIALAIASFSTPVWVAIGHETDSGVLDVVAHTSFKTPTALAEEIVGRYEQALNEVRTAENRLLREWTHIMNLQKQRVEKDAVGLGQGSRKLAELTRSELRRAMEGMRRAISERTAAEHRRIDARQRDLHSTATGSIDAAVRIAFTHAGAVRTLATHALRVSRDATAAQRMRLSPERLHIMLDQRTAVLRQLLSACIAAGRRGSDRHAERYRRLLERFRTTSIQLRLRQESDSLAHRHRNVIAYDPRKALERGYTIVKQQDGMILKSVTATIAGMPVRIEFHDGEAQAAITSKETTHE